MAGGVECASPSACPALVACSGVRGGTHGRVAAQQAAAGAARRRCRPGGAGDCAAMLLCSALKLCLGSEAEEGERRERELTLFIIFFSKFSMEARKILNTKVVQNSKPYNFRFRHKLI